MKRRCIHIALAIAFMFSLGFADAGDSKAATDCNGYYFGSVGPCIPEPFATYWHQHGDVIQQGNPISDAAQEQSALDGKIYLTQYFERAVFEWHPENQPPYNVLLAQIGTFRYKRKYPNGATVDYTWPNNNHRFRENGYTLGGKFYAYWIAHGGLAQQGLPISPVFKETSEYDGKNYYVQYFERAEFQWHPENANIIYEVSSILFAKEAYEAARTNGSDLKIADINTLKSYHISAKSTNPNGVGLDSLQVESDVIAPDKARMTITSATSGVTNTISYIIIDDDAYSSLPGGGPVKGGGGKYLMKYYLSQFPPAYYKVSSYNGYELVGNEAIDGADCQHYRYTNYFAAANIVMRIDAWISVSDHTVRQQQVKVNNNEYFYNTSFTLTNVNNVPDITPPSP